MGGAFLTSREIFTNPIWSNIVEFRLFFLIYGNAVFSDEGVRVGEVTLQRGQWLRSIRNLQKDLEYTENRAVKSYSTATIKRAIDSLVKQNRITSEVSELGTLFTVVNYAVYQGFDHYAEGNAKRRGNSNETATKQQRNNNNNVINAMKVEEGLKESTSSRRKQKPVYDKDSVHYKFAEYLLGKIIEWKPNFKKPSEANLQSWADSFRLMMEQDGREKRSIFTVIDWATQDSFWQKNILSADKLRNKFDELEGKAKGDRQHGGKGKESSRRGRDDLIRESQNLEW